MCGEIPYIPPEVADEPTVIKAIRTCKSLPHVLSEHRIDMPFMRTSHLDFKVGEVIRDTENGQPCKVIAVDRSSFLITVHYADGRNRVAPCFNFRRLRDYPTRLFRRGDRVMQLCGLSFGQEYTVRFGRGSFFKHYGTTSLQPVELYIRVGTKESWWFAAVLAAIAYAVVRVIGMLNS